MGGDMFQKAGSMFCSFDTVVNVLIFFPRFFIKEKRESHNRGNKTELHNQGSPAFYANRIAERELRENTKTVAQSTAPPKDTTKKANTPEVIFEEEKREEDDDPSTIIRFRAK